MNIYVGNLPHQTTENDLRELFERFGQVQSAVIIKDKVTREPRGFGFVEMGDNEGNSAISELNGSEYVGRRLKVNEARPREEGGNFRSGGDRPQRNFGNNSGGGGGGFRSGGNDRRDFRR